MASVTLNPDDVKYTLSFAAKPFIPTRLRQLFDSPPVQADRVFKGPSPSSLFLQPNWRDAENHETLLPVFRVLERIDTANAAAFLLPEGEQIATQFQIQPLDRHHASRSMRDPSGVRITAMKQHTEALKLWRRLLRLEANAQARDITRYDIFNTHLEQYKVVDGHTWLKVLVPGLPESRPPVFVGDVLHIRLQGPEADKLEVSALVVTHAIRGSCTAPTPSAARRTSQDRYGGWGASRASIRRWAHCVEHALHFVPTGSLIDSERPGVAAFTGAGGGGVRGGSE
jgi:hypothetical protein